MAPGLQPSLIRCCSCAHPLLQDPLAAGEYVGDIISYYRRVEPQYRVAPDYMTSQVSCLLCYGRQTGSTSTSCFACLLLPPRHVWQELLTYLQSAHWQGVFTMLADTLLARCCSQMSVLFASLQVELVA